MSSCRGEAVVYTKPNCAGCNQAKMMLTINNICFKEQVVGKDISIEELAEVVGHPVRAVPQIVLNGQAINTVAELSKALASND